MYYNSMTIILSGKNYISQLIFAKNETLIKNENLKIKRIISICTEKSS